MKKKALRRLLPLLLAAILCITQEIPALAGTAAAAGGEETKVFISNDRGAKARLNNPSHYCLKGKRKEDVTAWSYVYFGSYPQKEVKGSALTAKIKNASYDKNGNAWVNGTRYHRATRDDCENGWGNFGSKTYRYFKWEKIRWRVLVDDGYYLGLLADQALDSRSYDYDGRNITWEKSSIRKWLNKTFYQTAFTSKEQAAIATAKVITNKNPDYGTKGGKTTSDKIYMLSLEETAYRSLGFCESNEEESSSRQIKPTDYAEAMGADRQTGGYCDWWLRSPGILGDWAVYVNKNGFQSTTGWIVESGAEGCVPTLWVKHSSSLWKEAPPLLKTPTGLKAKLASGDAVKLTWKKVKGASSYTIYRYEPKDEWAYAIKTVKGTSYTDKKLKSGKTYCYYIAARNGTKISFSSKEVKKKVVGKPTKPKMTFTANSAEKKFTISWKTVKNASKMEILRAAGNGNFKVWKTVSAKSGKVSYSYDLLEKGVQYRFALRAYNKADGKTIYSDVSNMISFKPKQ